MRTLRDLPGPPTRPGIGNALQFRRDRLAFLTSCARQYGDAMRFRIGPVDVALMSHPDAVRELLTVRQRDFTKGPLLTRARAVLGDGLLTSEGEVHKHDRRLLQAAFHRRRVSQYAEEMLDVATDRVRTWAPGQPINIHAETVRTTLTVAGRTLFGTRLDDDVRLVSDALDDLLSAYGTLLLPLGQYLVRLPPSRQRVRRGTAALDELTTRLIAERRVDDTGNGDDLLSVLIAQGSPQQARDQVVTLLLAGHETTANAIAFACHLLAVHASVQQTVADEVLTVCGAEDELSVDDVDRLPTVRAVLAEAIRLFPPSWAMGRQTRDATEICGIELPQGTVVLVSQWVVHRDPRWWPDPGRFDPERFHPAPGQPTEQQRPRFAYFPFGGGTRQCIGEGFAWTEGVLTLATILARWRLQPVRGHAPTLNPLLTLRPRDGVWIVPESRRSRPCG